MAQEFRVQAMPTFLVMKGSQKIDEMKGANPAALMALVKKHAPSSGSGGASGSGSSSTPIEKGLEGFVSFTSTNFLFSELILPNLAATRHLSTRV